MVAGVDMAYALASTLWMITAHLHLPPVPTIVCTESYSLYEFRKYTNTDKHLRNAEKPVLSRVRHATQSGAAGRTILRNTSSRNNSIDVGDANADAPTIIP